MKRTVLLLSLIAILTGCATTSKPTSMERDYLAQREVNDAFNRVAWGYWRSWK